MSGISKNIRKITEAWGGKTTGSGIGDAIMDLYNSLPFSVKTEMVEILPDTLLVSTSASSNTTQIGGESLSPLALEDGKEYFVKVNGEIYKDVCVKQGSYLQIGDWTYSTGTPVFIDSGTRVRVRWEFDKFGTSITLGIYEEKTVIKPIDYKFMPEGYPKVETETVEVVPEQSVTTVDEHSEGFGSALLSVMPQNIVADEEYKVVFDGVDYICKAFEESEGCLYLGGVYAEEGYNFNGYPFILEILYSGEETYFLTTETGIHTIALYEEKEVVEKLDPKFLPDSMGGGTVFYTKSDTGLLLFVDKECTIEAVQEDVIKAMYSHIVIESVDSSDGGIAVFNAIGVFISDNGGAVVNTLGALSDGGVQVNSYVTADYNAGGGVS